MHLPLRNLLVQHQAGMNCALLQVPLRNYEMSCHWFCAVFLVGLISLLFEAAPARRQLACLTCTIKAIAWHADFALTRADASHYVWLDGNGQP